MAVFLIENKEYKWPFFGMRIIKIHGRFFGLRIMKINGRFLIDNAVFLYQILKLQRFILQKIFRPPPSQNC